MKYLFVTIVIFFLIKNYCHTTPELSIWSGNKCSKCHINPQGGGIRTEFGWKYLRDASQFPIGKDEIKKIYELFDKEQYWSKLSFEQEGKDSLGFSYGFDFRFQSVRSHRTELAKRKFFPMEAAIYVLLKPNEFINFNGQYNLGSLVFQGQDNWTASANIKILDFLPEIQLGKFQPSFGIRDCDMTRFDRRIASVDYSSSLFPPDYSEFGIELSYRKFDYFDFFIGIFDSRFLSQVTIFGDRPIVLKHNPTFNSKFVFYPNVINDVLTYSFLGTSVLVNGNFLYSSSFIGINFFETIGLFYEYAFSSLKELRRTNNFSVKLIYFASRGVLPFLMYENASTSLTITSENVWKLSNNSIVLGVRYFPIPYLEFVGEYRYFKSMESKSTRWAFQLHLYY
ncbi:MAG: hypothetical protein N2560_01845 [Ignavibacteria bacterium]|nr:hypothetical protein [Ignavibacteria bacterium]